MNERRYHVDLLRRKAIALKLDYQPEFEKAKNSELETLYNGCGPDGWPEWLRGVATSATADYEPAWLIHDYDYTHPPTNSRASWRVITVRCADNCYKLTMARPTEGIFPYIFKYIEAKAIRKAVYTALSSEASWEAFIQ